MQLLTFLCLPTWCHRFGELWPTRGGLSLMRVRVDPHTWDPAGEPELVAAGRVSDDFCIDEDPGILYVGTHRQITIDRVAMEPGDNSGFTESVAGDPSTEELIGPAVGAWSRTPGEYGMWLSSSRTAAPHRPRQVGNGKLPAHRRLRAGALKPHQRGRGRDPSVLRAASPLEEHAVLRDSALAGDHRRHRLA